ncbi:pectin acetylesterase 8-like [Salvia splendens]|uniref:pectin acetylesterase 8-like n=1 Tax=Salvia splendens TaxID=180675 RepID=UPI001C25F346|nr:pectin acetylesterase 8-like [Salvia splendens]
MPRSCTSKRDPNLCLFAEYLVEDVATPLFILEAAFDSYQIKTNFILTVPGLDRMQWENCSKSLEQCNATEIGIIKDFGPIFKKTLMKLGNSSSRGVFLDSCYLHLQFYSTYNWISAPVLHNKTIQKAIGDWFYDRSTFQEIDNPLYPQNCYGPDAPYDETIHPCSFTLTHYVRSDCFFNVMAIDVGNSCNLTPKEAQSMASGIWRSVYGA